MKPPTSLARSLSHVSTTVTSTSRIPHLRIHILHRQRVRGAGSTTQKRAHSTVLEPPSFSPFGQKSEDSVESGYEVESTARSSENARGTFTWEHSNLRYDSSIDQTIDVDSSAQIQTDTFESLLEDALPERTLFWLSRHTDGLDFTVRASEADFERVFCSLDPDIIFGAFKAALKSFQFTTRDIGDVAIQDRSLVKRFRLFLPILHEILRRREASGKPITLALCRHTLKCCVAIGDRKAAAMIVQNMVPTFNIEMDLDCYNYLMEVQITNLSFGSTALAGDALNQHLFDLRSRSRTMRPPSVRGYMLSSQDPEPILSLRGQVLWYFQTITQKGFQPSEQTFVNLIMGLAKSGDVTGVDSILKSVWNIDVRALDTFDEEEIESPTFYEDGHPLRPSSKLLFAIVHAYGLNKDEKKAAALLDYTSRNYAIDIPLETWEELFTWTYANNIHKSLSRREQGQAFGSDGDRGVELLYNKVIDVPYNLEPSSRIVDLLTRSFRARCDQKGCFDSLRQLREQAVPMIDLLQNMVSAAKALQRHPSLATSNGMPSKELFAFRRDFQFAFLKAQSHLMMFRRNLKRALNDRSRFASGSWSHRSLPTLIEEFHPHLPLILNYHISTGSVRLYRYFNAKEENPLWLTLNKASLFWDALSATDPADIIKRLMDVPDNLDAASRAVFGKDADTPDEEFAIAVASAVLTGIND